MEVGTMTRAMQVHPGGLVKALVEGIKLQKQWDRGGLYYLDNVGIGSTDLDDKQQSGIGVGQIPLRKNKSGISSQ